VQIPEIDVEALAELVGPDLVLLDVRMVDEYEEGHVPGAILIPLPELEDRVSEVPSGDPLYVICRSGARSLRASEFLAGFGQSVVNVAGGTLAWTDSGRAVVTGTEPV